MRNKNYYFAALIFVALPSLVFASDRFEWISGQGFPYLLRQKNGHQIEFYCYGEVEDLLSNKKVEILCRALPNRECPEADNCYKDRAIEGELP